jgi:hypothetical protein
VGGAVPDLLLRLDCVYKLLRRSRACAARTGTVCIAPIGAAWYCKGKAVELCAAGACMGGTGTVRVE